ncbi:MAG: MATE family efflux transporter [Clostridia bacterium]|nr:MATE family efflux transporter [Clostridia bacterium]
MTRVEKTRSIDMTSGPLFGKILWFILPLIATNLLQMLYNAADIVVVGLSSDPDAVGAVGSTSAFLNLVVNIFIGFSTGADVVVARYIGARDRENTSRSVHTAICMGLIFGVVGGVVGIALARPVLSLMGYEGNLLELGLRYCCIYLACLPFLALTNFLCAILRAKGDTRTPLFVLAGAGLLNVLLNLFFVLVVGLSVEGVAIATAIANATSAVLLWRHLACDKGDCRISFRLLRPSRAQFLEISRIGFPAGLQNAMFSISNMLIQSSILQVNNTVTPPNSAYAPVIKGDSATNSIEGFLFSALNATTVAASAFTGQNVGVGDYRRVRRVLLLVAAVSVGIAAVMSGAILIFHDPLLSLYGVTNAEDTLSQLAYNTAMSRVWFKWPTFVIFAMMNSAAGVLRGLGKSMTSATISLVGTCVFRVVWIYTVFAAIGRVEAIYISYPISWFLTGAVFWVTVLIMLKRKIKV